MVATKRGIIGALAFMALLMVMMLQAPMVACATETQSQGMLIELESDQEAYAPGDVATFTLSATNRNASTIQTVSYALSLPENMMPNGPSAIEDTIGAIAPNETRSIQMSATVLDDAQTMLARTGDESMGKAMLSFVAILAIALALVMRERKPTPVTFRKVSRDVRATTMRGRTRRTDENESRAGHMLISIVLAIGLIVPLSFASTSEAHAEESPQTVSIAHKVNVDEAEHTILASLSFPTATSDVVFDEEASDSKHIQGGGGETGLMTGGSGPSLKGSNVEVTRGEWISMLLDAADVRIASTAECSYADIADSEHEASIATAYVRGIIPDAEDMARFDPNGTATREFALASAVLACGFTDDSSELDVVDASDVRYTALLAIAIDMDMVAPDDEGCIRPADALTKVAAGKICNAVSSFFASDHISTEGVDIVFQPDVVVIDDYDATPSGFIVDGDALDLTVGSKVAFKGTDANPGGAAGTITDVSPASATSTGIEVTIAQATNLEEIFSSVRITEYDKALDMSEAELADGVELDDGAELYGLERAAYNPSFDKKIKIKDREIPHFGTISASLKMEYSASIDLEWSAFAKLKKFEYILSSKSTVEVKYEAEKELFERTAYTLPLLKKPMNIPIAYGIGIAFNVSLEVEASGEAKVSASLEQAAGVKYAKGHFSTYQDGDADAEVELSAEVSAGLSPAAMLTLMSIELLDLTCEVGLKAKGAVTWRSTGLKCNDVIGYLYGKLGSGQNTAWMESLKVKLTYADFWTERTSPKKWNLHYEDGKRVKKCTYDDESADSSMGDDGKDCELETKEPWVLLGYDSSHVKTDRFGTIVTCHEGEKLTIESSDWFDFFYSTDYSRPMGRRCGAIFKVSWDDADGHTSHEQWYADVVESRSPVHSGTVTISVLSGYIDIYSTSYRGQSPSLSWDEGEKTSYPLHISNDEIELSVGESFQLACTQDITESFPALKDLPDVSESESAWSSTDRDCVSVDSNGLVTAKSPGYSYVYCDYRGFSCMCEVIVR